MPDYAVYGISFYGTARYGRAPVSDLYLAKFTANPEGYSQVRVEWGAPTGSWDMLRLVRGSYGYPTDEVDGSVLLEASAALAPGAYSYIDTAVEQMRFYYYTLFLRQTIDGAWIRAGNVVVLMPGAWGYTSRLYDLLPQYLRDGDAIYTIASGPDQGAGQLQTFCAVLGYECDHLRSELESLLWVALPNKMSGGLLPLMAAQLGTTYEAELGMAFNRRILNSIVHLYKIKGTEPGVEGAAYAFSGWAAEASAEVNGMLSNDDSNFETGVGRWTEQTNVVLSRGITQGLLPTSGMGVLIMTAVSAGLMEARLPATQDASLPLLLNPAWPSFAGPPSLPLLLGASAPVQFLPSFYGAVLPDAAVTPPGASLPLLLGNSGGQPFTFSAHFQPITTARNVFVRLIFFNAANGVVGSYDGTPVAEVTNSVVRASVSGVAPATARYAGFALVVMSPGAGEQHRVDALQFEPGKVGVTLPILLNRAVPTAWQPPGGVKLVLRADRVNRAVNPSFEAETTGWTPIGGTLTRVSSISDVAGSWSGQLVAFAGQRQLGVRTTALVPVTAGVMMAFSSYWQALTTPQPVVSRVDWYDQGGQVISSLASATQSQLPLLLGAVPVTTELVGSWVRFPFLAIPPAGTVGCLYSTFVQPVAGNLATGETHYVDCVLIEQAASVNPYFDASTGSPLTDYLWEGTPHLSRSHYYHRRAVREARLRTRLPDFLPAGATLRILDAQPV